jgi:hypothetical protein
MRVTFVRDTLQHEHGRDVEGFKKGQTYDLPPGSAQRWINRGACEVAKTPEPVPAPAAPKPVIAPAKPSAPTRSKGADDE